MSVEDNKQVAQSFFECLSNGDLDGALNFNRRKRDVVAGGQARPVRDCRHQEQGTVRRDAAHDRNWDAQRIRLTITGVTAEGDRVAVEMNANGVSATGEKYENEYHDLLEIRGGKIVAGREYLDTAHAAEVIVGSAKAAAMAG